MNGRADSYNEPKDTAKPAMYPHSHLPQQTFFRVLFLTELKDQIFCSKANDIETKTE
jgi:hypothetical protein